MNAGGVLAIAEKFVLKQQISFKLKYEELHFSLVNSQQISDTYVHCGQRPDTDE